VQPDELMFSLLLRAHGGGAEPKWTDISALLGLMKHTWGIAPSAITCVPHAARLRAATCSPLAQIQRASRHLRPAERL